MGLETTFLVSSSELGGVGEVRMGSSLLLMEAMEGSDSDESSAGGKLGCPGLGCFGGVNARLTCERVLSLAAEAMCRWREYVTHRAYTISCSNPEPSSSSTSASAFLVSDITTLI